MVRRERYGATSYPAHFPSSVDESSEPRLGHLPLFRQGQFRRKSRARTQIPVAHPDLGWITLQSNRACFRLYQQVSLPASTVGGRDGRDEPGVCPALPSHPAAGSAPRRDPEGRRGHHSGRVPLPLSGRHGLSPPGRGRACPYGAALLTVRLSREGSITPPKRARVRPAEALRGTQPRGAAGQGRAPWRGGGAGAAAAGIGARRHRPAGRGGGGGGRRSGGADRGELAGLGAAVPEDGGGGAGRWSGWRGLRARPFLLLGFRAALQRAPRRRLRAADPEVPQPVRGPDRHAPQVRGAALRRGVEPVHRPAEGLPGQRALQGAPGPAADPGESWRRHRCVRGRAGSPAQPGPVCPAAAAPGPRREKRAILERAGTLGAAPTAHARSSLPGNFWFPEPGRQVRFAPRAW